MNAKVKGLKELAHMMQQLPEKMEKNVMRGALRAGAKVLEAETLNNVPVDQGALKKSIKIRTSNKRGEIVASVRATDFKARWIEYGTAAHWIKVDEKAAPTRMTRRGLKAVSVSTLNEMAAKGSLKIGETFAGASVLHPGAKAQPYMRPALDAKSTEAVIAAGNYIKNRLASKHGLDTSGVTVEADET